MFAITEYQIFKGLGTAFECTGVVKKGVKYDCALLAVDTI